MPDIRAIAFYLPQFHPIPENDEWWGPGFTEWHNVTKARPAFPGHYQPHLPADLGFYDLRLPEAREAQAELARQYGIHGFCYYHYWFNGRRILEQPFNKVLESRKPDFPFCLCWANENWTRAWNGGENHVLLRQQYSHEDDLIHIRNLLPAFQDDRYIRINNRPLFLVYRTGLLPDPQHTAEIWREVALKEGIGDIYLARVESFSDETAPNSIGFDASVEFVPNRSYAGIEPFDTQIYQFFGRLNLFPKGLINRKVFDYDEVVKAMIRRPNPDYKKFRCVTPNWDNSARRKEGGVTFINSTPEKYGYWLNEAVENTNRIFSGDEKIIFINAWNEWAEGNHLEPDNRWGRAYLEETVNVLKTSERNTTHLSIIRESPPYTRPLLFLKYYMDRYINWRFKR
ncbi:glycoside hydrolase family 99-like domain-containing protein [Methylobacter marinus]|uniref:glycoside hydrolase family 99-like domain-containing protein n=1 Tax=Methylobacter marinus TaxID=34058 RepID=UPI000363A020|nr:glycoside hydrolase family 99-like domain-containing protein [Methylobacter marinus]